MFNNFNGFDFNFNMMPPTCFKLYESKKRIDKSKRVSVDYEDNDYKVVKEPLVSSNYNNIGYSNQPGGDIRTETNLWWSHIPNVPINSKLECDDGRRFVTTSKGRSDLVPGSYVYNVKGVDNDV